MRYRAAQEGASEFSGTACITDEYAQKFQSAAAKTVLDRSASAKGASEVLDVIDLSGNKIGTYPRQTVEKYNLVHRAIGYAGALASCVLFFKLELRRVLVHNSNGHIYVHQRSPNKSMHASYYDMFVGGLLLSGETAAEGARNEVVEELGIFGGQLEHLFDTVWLGSKNRVFLSCFRVVAEDSDISHNDGEVVWGQFISLSELHNMMQSEDFVPGGLKAWAETCSRNLHHKYLQ
mmetsp:Transcript_10047/g.15721  ORF Transcript_10047/g.15721 Transcript_10047/m.15721 type:complete len:234 (+) Transcript_10047:1-702(+)